MTSPHGCHQRADMGARDEGLTLRGAVCLGGSPRSPLSLLSQAEVDRLDVWASPLEHTSSRQRGASAVSPHPSTSMSDAPTAGCFSVWPSACSRGAGGHVQHGSHPTAASWGDHVSTAWGADPQLAIALLDHFGRKPAIVRRLQALVLADASNPRVQVRPAKGADPRQLHPHGLRRVSHRTAIFYLR